MQGIANGKSGAVYNIVNVQLSENQWYTQWLCTGAFPTMYVFGKDGRLTAALDAVLKKTDYPWLVWLQVLNEQKQGRSAAEAATRLAQFTDPRVGCCLRDIATMRLSAGPIG